MSPYIILHVISRIKLQYSIILEMVRVEFHYHSLYLPRQFIYHEFSSIILFFFFISFRSMKSVRNWGGEDLPLCTEHAVSTLALMLLLRRFEP